VTRRAVPSSRPLPKDTAVPARLLPALALAALVPLVLTGCSVGDALHGRTSGTVASPAALAHAWRTPASEPDWVPADATGIRFVAATGGSADASPASVRPCSASPTEQPVSTRGTSGTVASPAALAHAWRTPASEPDWVPADATGIRFVAATGGSADASPASVRVVTASALPDSCTTIPRRSLDSFGEDWAPSSFPDTVSRCGNWAVMRVDDGWFGWTPLAPAERAE
jgi:hypothetical protein